MKKAFSPHDLWRFSYLSWPQLSPDGKLAAVVLKAPDEDGVCQPRVRVIDIETGRAVYETAPEHHEAQPLFLPAGGFALLSDESGEYQVWVVRDNARVKLTSLRHGVQHYDIREHFIAFEALLWQEEIENGSANKEMSPEEKKAFQEELSLRPYVAQDLTYKMDEWFGMRKGEMPRVGLTDGKTVRFLPEQTEAVYPALSPDGRTAAFFCYPHKGPQGRKPELALWDTETDKISRLQGDWALDASQAPVFSPCGDSLYFPVSREYENGWSNVIAAADLKQEGPALFYPDLTDDTACSGVSELIVSRTENGENRSCFSVLPDRLLFLAAHHGKSRLFTVPLDKPREAADLNMPFEDITGFAADASGRLAVLAGTSCAPADLFADGKRLTDEHAWLSAYESPRTEAFTVRSRDGRTKLHYQLTYPLGYQPGKRYPAVLDIKGGLETMYGAGYWHEFHALSAAGFAVIHGNPRGSAGYGRAFRPNGVCWQDEPLNDLMDMCLDAVRRGIADEKRIGVTGGSYGGYMTIKLITKTDFFTAAAGQRVFVNPGTSYGTGDVGWVSANGEIPPHFSMLRYLQDRARNSNASRVDNIRVPLLLLHGYRDYRCTFEQAEQIFIPLRQRHPEVPVRLVMFPNENHALTRTGNMKAQERHLQELVGWFCTYLTNKEEPSHEAACEH